MRASRIGFWLSAFLVAGALPAFCQVIVQPNGSGKTVPVDAAVGRFQQSVSTTGPIDYTLVVIKNFTPKFSGSGTVCTSGPSVNLSIDVPLSSFGMSAGDTLIFALTVKHRGSEGNTTSVIVSIIPVVGATPSPTTQRLIPTKALERIPVARDERSV